MTALAAVRTDQNWHDGLVMLAVAGGLVGLALADFTLAKVTSWRETRATRTAVQTHAHGPSVMPASYVPLRAVEVDHEACTGEGCDQVVCFCRQTSTCADAVNVGCLHLTWVGVLCPDCRRECPKCRSEDHADRAFDAARGK